MTLKQKSEEQYRESSGEDEMVFFAVPKREDEDDSRYFGSPYGREDWEEPYFEKRAVERVKPTLKPSVPPCYSDQQNRQSDGEERPFFVQEEGEKLPIHGLGSDDVIEEPFLERSVNAPAVASQEIDEATFQESMAPTPEVKVFLSSLSRKKKVSTARSARKGVVFSDIVYAPPKRTEEDLAGYSPSHRESADVESRIPVFVENPIAESVISYPVAQEEPENPVFSQEEIPATPERVFEREYPEYAYRHLGQRFFDPPKEYFAFVPEVAEREADTESAMDEMGAELETGADIEIKEERWGEVLRMEERMTVEEEGEEDVEEVRAENVELFPNVQEYAESAEPEPMPGYIGSEYWEDDRTPENIYDTAPEVLEEKAVSTPVEDISQIGSDRWEESPFSRIKRIARKFFGFFAVLRDVFSPGSFAFGAPKLSYAYVLLGGALLLGFGGVSYISRGLSLQGSVLGVTNRGVDDALLAVESIKKQDFSGSSEQFELAAGSFRSASKELSSWAGVLSNIPSSIPILSKVSSGNNALNAGEHLALAGKHMSDMAELVSAVRNPDAQMPSLLSLFQKGMEFSDRARIELLEAQKFLEKVRLADIPEEKRDRFIKLKQTVPLVLAGLDTAHANAPAFTDVLGGNGPRKYLFLFQNNQEARATGGFIGSYGVLDMKDGSIRKFFIDGIFNPDGQLREDIVPPQPIRKVSAGWSLHDSNWFADFPTSAEKAISFYEKTGGPTVDGVITITPVVLQRILEATGPVHLPEYDITIDCENVIPTLQYKVEVDYDKEENRPKKILGDLAPVLLERIMQMQDPESASRIVEVLHSSLREKHILLYSRNSALQSMYREMGWSGELKETSNDFLSVVNSNINGFKTDGVIDQAVHHSAHIGEDGTVTNTVTVTRKHNGGDTPYEWWNGVNANYMRLYVPKGSRLLSASGHTRETVKDPLDYRALEFERDDLVAKIENTLKTDSATGTQIFEESGKTVFGNWVYVSPKEAVTVTYVYELPFRAVQGKNKNLAVYSLLAQKQSGSVTSEFASEVTYPEEWKTAWLSRDANEASGSVSFSGNLRTDTFAGYVFER